MVESKGKFLYVANQGNNITGTNAQSGIAGYYHHHRAFLPAQLHPRPPFGSGSGPQCIVEDPSDQFIYTANAYDSTIPARASIPTPAYSTRCA